VVSEFVELLSNRPLLTAYLLPSSHNLEVGSSQKAFGNNGLPSSFLTSDFGLQTSVFGLRSSVFRLLSSLNLKVGSWQGVSWQWFAEVTRDLLQTQCCHFTCPW
jgi:hypothetical protein